MRTRVLTSILSLALVASLGVMRVASQHSATVTLRNGEVLSGDLIDLGGVGFTVRVNGQIRQIPRGEVASIDFGGDAINVPEAARTLSAENTFVILRNGTSLTGEFYDVSGTQPLRLTFRTPNGERIIEAGEVRRIYLVPVNGTVAGVSGLGQQATTVTVSSRQAWTPTGVTVRQGQTIRFASSGELTFSPQGHRATVVGSSDNLRDSKAPMPQVLQGALIGRIGTGVGVRAAATGTVFAIGNLSELVAPATGQLFLGINDSGLNDNQGNFSVTMTVVP